MTSTTLRQDIFKAFFDLINSNKITGSYCYTSFNDKAVQYPIYVIHPVRINSFDESFDGAYDETGTLFIELYSPARYSKEKVDKMADNIRETLLNNIQTLKDNGILLRRNFLSDMDEDTFEYNGRKMHYRSLMINFSVE